MNQIDWDKYIGDFIASGSSRKVYHNKINPDTVIKIDYGNSFQNVKEYLLSEELQFTEDYHKLAKCKHISSDGKYLIQEYARDLTDEEFKQFKDMRFPNFLTDIKRSNLGVTKDGNIVFRDYGSSILTYNYRLRKVRKGEIHE